jgi:glycosyltransferase involved in cell wall biosynthesis
VGCIARLRKQKGYELFLRTAARVLAQMPTVRFLIVGDGEEREQLDCLAKQLRIDGSVVFAGARTDIERIIPVFSVFLLTSHYEGMPICLLESLASGIPIVSTSVGGVPEVIENGVSGFLVDSRNPDQIAGKVMQLLTDGSLREKMGKAALMAYESRFTVKEMVDQYERLYDRCLRRKVLV